MIVTQLHNEMGCILVRASLRRRQRFGKDGAAHCGGWPRFAGRMSIGLRPKNWLPFVILTPISDGGFVAKVPFVELSVDPSRTISIARNLQRARSDCPKQASPEGESAYALRLNGSIPVYRRS